MIEWSRIERWESETIESVPEDAVIHSIDGKDVEERCENCGKYLFTEDDWLVYVDGNVLCMECDQSLKEDDNARSN
ncbi:MAG: hypothetical protein PQJ59_16820 [Spirochaetales bacterium]|nr:hypothetical protein [Spirochaetales bacterium]